MFAHVPSANYFLCVRSPTSLCIPKLISPIPAFYAVPNALYHRFIPSDFYTAFLNLFQWASYYMYVGRMIYGIKSACEIGSGPHSMFHNPPLCLLPCLKSLETKTVELTATPVLPSLFFIISAVVF